MKKGKKGCGSVSANIGGSVWTPGGGNAKDITFSLPVDVTIVPNTDGLTGGVRLWRNNLKAHAAADDPGTGTIAAEAETPQGTAANQDLPDKPEQAPDTPE